MEELRAPLWIGEFGLDPEDITSWTVDLFKTNAPPVTGWAYWAS
jgi:hypothetical protein